MNKIVKNGLNVGILLSIILLNITPILTGNMNISSSISTDASFSNEISPLNLLKWHDKYSTELDFNSPQNISFCDFLTYQPGILFPKVSCSSRDITFTKHVIDTTLDYVFGIFACDIDYDGDSDILAAAQESNEIVLYLNNGEGHINWTRIVIDDAFEGATNIFAADIDGDTDLDVVGSASYANQIAWWRNDGGKNLTLWTKHIIRRGFDFAHEVYCHDLDNDGDFDILAASSFDHQIAWWRNEGGEPVRWTEQIISSNFLGAKSIRVADVDNDGFLDVVGAAITANKICWWKNNGGEPIEWEEHLIDGAFSGAHRVEVCDMNFDGNIDVVGAAYFGREISWWKNEGGSPITWTKQVVATDFNGACIGLPVDIDEDGDIDIVGTAQQAHDVAYFRNDGGNPPGWTKIMIDTFFQGAWPGFVSDIDGDGDIDIVAGASWGDMLAWWESDLNQQPLKPTRPIGTLSGRTGAEYIYTAVTSDPEDNQLFYLFDWGDNNDSGWLGPYESGIEVNASNIWYNQGDFEIRVKAKNTQGSESEWSDPLVVSMPYIHMPIRDFLEKIFHWFVYTFLSF